MDTLNKHECLSFVTHKVKAGLIVFDSFAASSLVAVETLFPSQAQSVYLHTLFFYLKQRI